MDADRMNMGSEIHMDAYASAGERGSLPWFLVGKLGLVLTAAILAGSCMSAYKVVERVKRKGELEAAAETLADALSIADYLPGSSAIKLELPNAEEIRSIAVLGRPDEGGTLAEVLVKGSGGMEVRRAVSLGAKTRIGMQGPTGSCRDDLGFPIAIANSEGSLRIEVRIENSSRKIFIEVV